MATYRKVENLINSSGYWVTDEERECTKCGVIYKKTSKTVALCHSCNTERVKSTMTPEWKMHQRAKNRAKLNGRDFDLQVSDIMIPINCPILGIELEVHSGSSGGRSNSPSLDRIDNDKGYTKDNIRVVSHLANQMKGSASPSQLRRFATWILKTFGTD